MDHPQRYVLDGVITVLDAKHRLIIIERGNGSNSLTFGLFPGDNQLLAHIIYFGNLRIRPFLQNTFRCPPMVGVKEPTGPNVKTNVRYVLDGIITVVDAKQILERVDEEKPEGVENEAVEQVQPCVG